MAAAGGDLATGRLGDLGQVGGRSHLSPLHGTGRGGGIPPDLLHDVLDLADEEVQFEWAPRFAPSGFKVEIFDLKDRDSAASSSNR